MNIDWLPKFELKSLCSRLDSAHAALVLVFPIHTLDILSQRQFEVSNLHADGLSYKQICKRLSLHMSTVRLHLKEAKHHFGVDSTSELMLQIGFLRLMRAVLRSELNNENDKTE